MDNQHRKIADHRKLSRAEIDLMLEIEAERPRLNALIQRVFAHAAEQRRRADEMAGDDAAVEHYRLAQATPERWTEIASVHLQQGLMALTRAVAQPTFF